MRKIKTTTISCEENTRKYIAEEAKRTGLRQREVLVKIVENYKRSLKTQKKSKTNNKINSPEIEEIYEKIITKNINRIIAFLQKQEEWFLKPTLQVQEKNNINIQTIIDFLSQLKEELSQEPEPEQYIIFDMKKIKKVSAVLEDRLLNCTLNQEEDEWFLPNKELVPRIITDPITGEQKTQTISQAVCSRIKNAGISKIRNNQNTCIKVFFSGSSKTMCAMTQEQLDNWANDTLTWAQNQWGKENIVSATLHNHGETPNLCLIMVPIVQGKSRRSASEEKNNKTKGKKTRKYKIDTTKNRLCANEFVIKPLLSEYRTSYAEIVGKKYGLSRGVPKA